MRMEITESDARTLTGKFIIRLDLNNPNLTLNDASWDFLSEKRLTFVSGLSFCGLFYERNSYESYKEMAEYFNDKSNGYFHRFLTTKELDFLCEKLKETVY